ncbi:hypothetical protein IFR05_013441, partial [Cadophora sp. M221]
MAISVPKPKNNMIQAALRLDGQRRSICEIAQRSSVAYFPAQGIHDLRIEHHPNETGQCTLFCPSGLDVVNQKAEKFSPSRLWYTRQSIPNLDRLVISKATGHRAVEVCNSLPSGDPNFVSVYERTLC